MEICPVDFEINMLYQSEWKMRIPAHIKEAFESWPIDVRIEAALELAALARWSKPDLPPFDLAAVIDPDIDVFVRSFRDGGAIFSIAVAAQEANTTLVVAAKAGAMTGREAAHAANTYLRPTAGAIHTFDRS